MPELVGEVARLEKLGSRRPHVICGPAMLIGYFDESEAHVGHRLFAVGGYIALDDDWTVVTQDGSYSAHFEHTVAITEGDADILTL